MPGMESWSPLRIQLQNVLSLRLGALVSIYEKLDVPMLYGCVGDMFSQGDYASYSMDLTETKRSAPNRLPTIMIHRVYNATTSSGMFSASSIMAETHPALPSTLRTPERRFPIIRWRYLVEGGAIKDRRERANVVSRGNGKRCLVGTIVIECCYKSEKDMM